MDAYDLDLDALMADLLATYDHMPPGVQAEVEQATAAIRDGLGREGLTPTVGRARAVLARLILVGLAAGVGPGPSPQADWLGIHVAGASLLARQLEQRETRR